MSRTTIEQCGVQVALTDCEGYETGRVVSVTIDYLQDVDSNWGADADGQRGITRVECDILDWSIDPQDCLTMDLGQIERALAVATAIFHQRQKHFL